MKKRLQGLIAGALIGIILTSGGVFAKQVTETAELFYNNIKISLNGKQLQPKDADGNYVEPFIINGTTYLPVRAVANALGINVGWDSNTNTVVLSNQKTENITTGFNESAISGKINVIKEYRWETDYGNYVGIVLNNNSGYTISPRIQMTFKDKDGKVVGAENQTENAFGSGHEMAFVFSNNESFASYEYIITVSEEKYYEECVSKLECSHSLTAEKAIIQVKNNGDKPAKFVGYVVFFKNGEKVVDYNRGFCIDDDSEIKPQLTEIEEVPSFYRKTFDSVEIYLTGRCSR